MELLQKYFDIALETPDGIKKMQELILTLAMQGKLVTQDPNDQPASELLKEIAAEKKRLIKEGIHREQDIQTPLVLNSMDNKIPDLWQWCRIQDLGFVLGGKRLPKGCDFSELPTSYRYLTVTNMKNNTIVDNNIKYISEQVRSEISKYIIKKEDIYITIAGTIGAVGIIPDKFDGMNLTENASRLVFSKVDKTFLVYLLNTSLVQNQFYALTNKMAQPKLSLRSILSTIISLPPLAEQKRIVAKIDQLMALCDKLETERNERNQKRLTVHTSAINRLLTAPNKIAFGTSWQFITKHFGELYSVIQNVTELKKVILQLAVMGKLVPQDPKDQPASELLKEIEAEKKQLLKEGKIRNQEPLLPIKPEEMPYEVPNSWKWVRLNDIAEYNGRANANPDEISPETWVLDLEDIEKDTSTIINQAVYADRQSKSTKSTFCKGDVLYGKLRPYLNKVVVADKAGVCTTEIVPIVPYKGIDSQFLKTLLKRPSFITLVNTLSYGVKMPRLGTADAVKSIHPLPPLAEQKRIVAKIDQLMALCDSLENNITSANDKQIAIFNAVLAKV